MPDLDEQDLRPNPEELLEGIDAEKTKKIGKLKIFFGYAAGVGKTYAMLTEAKERLREGVNVLVGYVEPHTRPETLALLRGLPELEPKTIEYKNIKLNEFDLDAALQKKPDLILVDELAHTNAQGMRNKKRFQDVEELLQAGIDVYTTVNVQHIESLNNVVCDVTKITVHETVPDYIFDHADSVKLIDIEPEELLKRLEEGKIYRTERAQKALENFFSSENLRILREIAIRKAADRISHENQSTQTVKAKQANSKLMVCVSHSPSSAKCIRWAARMADAFFIPWVAVYVKNQDSDYLSDEQKRDKRNNFELAERLGAEIVSISGDDIVNTIAEYARLSGITNVVIGKSRNKHLFKPDFEDQLIESMPNVEIHIIPSEAKAGTKVKRVLWDKHLYFSWADTFKTLGLILLASIVCMGLGFIGVGEQNLIMVYFLAVLVVTRITKGFVYGIVSAVISVLVYNFFFMEPRLTFTVIREGYPVTMLIMLVVAIISSALTARIKKQAKIAASREKNTEVLYEINKKLLATRGLNNILAVVTEYIVKLLGRSAIFYTNPREMSGYYVQAPNEDDCFMQKEDEKAVANWVYVNQKKAGAGTNTLMGAGVYYIPVISGGKTLGVLGICCKKSLPSQNSRFFLQMIASQAAMALERQALSDEQRQMIINARCGR